MQVMPEDAGYRIHVEKWFTYISKTCNEIEEVTHKSIYLMKLSIPPRKNFNLSRTFAVMNSSFILTICLCRIIDCCLFCCNILIVYQSHEIEDETHFIFTALSNV